MRSGDTDGIFQFESSGMKDVLRKVQPQSFLDIAALNALYRPGPMQFIDDYADRKHGRKSITYIFPELEEIIGETYGIIVYQEQVMRIAVEIAGFSLAKADTLRKAMGKKKQEIIDREGENFINGAVAKGHPKDKARKLWDQIVPFAKYGFNKSHSVAYAHVAYLTAYLKAHYTGAFHGGDADFGGGEHRQVESVPGAVQADGHRDPAAGNQCFDAHISPWNRTEFDSVLQRSKGSASRLSSRSSRRGIG